MKIIAALIYNLIVFGVIFYLIDQRGWSAWTILLGLCIMVTDFNESK